MHTRPQILEIQMDENKSKRTKLPFNLEAIKDFKATQSGEDNVQLSFTVSSLNPAQTGAVQKSGKIIFPPPHQSKL